jgi:poly-gamma-glutamate capsule biosynthesis protein CapA/YwtB (metallophosphatase superfamily)
MKNTLFTILIYLTNLSCACALSITGKITDEANIPLTGVNITSATEYVTTKNDGTFTFKLKTQDIYQLTIEKAGFYNSIHTFSYSEINNLKGQLDTIALVKKQSHRVMFAFAGDTMMTRRYYQPYFNHPTLLHANSLLADSKNIIRAMKPYLEIADFTSVNLETTIAEQAMDSRADKSINFVSHPETLSALKWAGVDYVTLGNNHIYDFQQQGLEQTFKYLDLSDIAYSGAGLNNKDAIQPHIERINNQPFAFSGFVGWPGTSKSTEVATQSQGGATLGNSNNLLESLNIAAKNQASAIIQYHGSQEYTEEPTLVTEQRLKNVLDSGAELAVAHHPHVTQGLELYNNKLLAYSLGNFIFDQNFSATQHSFILYVWMDNGQFHRAELVPIYIKGYKPTPAIGEHKHQTLQRISALSKRRHTLLTASGAHAVLSKSHQKKINTVRTHALGKLQIPLINTAKLGWQACPIAVHANNTPVPYRLGNNLINGSDFENFATFDANERQWLIENAAHSEIVGNNLNQAVSLTTKPQQPLWFGIQNFRRVYEPDTPVSLSFKIKNNSKLKIAVYWQGRKNGQQLLDAYTHSEKRLIQEINIDSNKVFKHLEIEFESPRRGYKSYRVLLEIQSVNPNQSTTFILDDMSLIQWDTAYKHAASPTDCLLPVTHIGLKSIPQYNIDVLSH